MKLKLAVLTAMCFAQVYSAWSQDIDQARLNRDIKIAEDILSSLVKSESKDGHFYSVKPKGSYIPNYGVIIRMNSSNSFYSSHYDNSFSFSFDDEDGNSHFDLGDIHELAREAQRIASEEEREARELEREIRAMERETEREELELARELEREERELERERRELERELKEVEKEAYVHIKSKYNSNHSRHNNDDEFTYRRSYSNDNDDDDELFDDHKVKFHYSGRNNSDDDLRVLYQDIITVFFSDYANLISQLKPSEKIMITVGGGSQSDLWQAKSENKFNGEIEVQHINDYKSSRITENEFINTITFSETNTEEKKAADLELLSSIFQRMYKADLATTFYTSSKIQHERIKNFGVMYKVKMYVSTKSGTDTYKIASTGQSNLSRTQRNKLAEEMFPTFERELKENMLNYGKTVRSLDEDESILFQVELASCTTCEIPKRITLIANYQTILDFDSGKITKPQALEQIKRGEN